VLHRPGYFLKFRCPLHPEILFQA